MGSRRFAPFAWPGSGNIRYGLGVEIGHSLFKMTCYLKPSSCWRELQDRRQTHYLNPKREFLLAVLLHLKNE